MLGPVSTAASQLQALVSSSPPLGSISILFFPSGRTWLLSRRACERVPGGFVRVYLVEAARYHSMLHGKCVRSSLTRYLAPPPALPFPEDRALPRLSRLSKQVSCRCRLLAVLKGCGTFSHSVLLVFITSHVQGEANPRLSEPRSVFTWVAQAWPRGSASRIGLFPCLHSSHLTVLAELLP